MSKIYFDNAASTPVHPEVIEVMYDTLKSIHGNPSSIHSHGRLARSKVEEARKTIANILKASISEIFFTSCATEANNTILLKTIESKGIKSVISSKLEHPSVYKTLVSINDRIDLKFVDNDKYGQLDLNHLDDLLKKNENSLVSIMTVNNELGNINPISKISELCDKYNSIFHTDAVQAIGKIPIDVSQVNISSLSASAHKFYGPTGIGFFYMNSENIFDPLILGGAQERNMRAGTENIAYIVGMAKALSIAVEELEINQKALSTIKAHFVSRLSSEFKDISINGTAADSASHILNVSFPPTEKADMLMFNLDINGISASSGSACSSGIPRDSQVLINIDHASERKAIRFSFSPTNTLEEVNRTIEILKTLTPTL